MPKNRKLVDQVATQEVKREQFHTLSTLLGKVRQLGGCKYQLPRIVGINIDEYKRGSDPLWVFRGMGDVDWPLKTSLEREFGADSHELSFFMRDEFVQNARLYTDLGPPEKGDDLNVRWTSLMQHFGAPTRLLDFTYSPSVALYFAFFGRKPEACDKKEPVAAVWALDLNAIVRTCIQRFDSELLKTRDCKPPSTINEYLLATADVALAPKAEQTSCLDEGYIAAVFPSEANPHLAAQQGLFLVNGSSRLCFHDSLPKMMARHKGQWRVRYEVPWSLRNNILRDLFDMNVHDLSLFPSIQGLCRYVKTKAELMSRQPEQR